MGSAAEHALRGRKGLRLSCYLAGRDAFQRAQMFLSPRRHHRERGCATAFSMTVKHGQSRQYRFRGVWAVQWYRRCRQLHQLGAPVGPSRLLHRDMVAPE